MEGCLYIELPRGPPSVLLPHGRRIHVNGSAEFAAAISGFCRCFMEGTSQRLLYATRNWRISAAASWKDQSERLLTTRRKRHQCFASWKADHRNRGLRFSARHQRYSSLLHGRETVAEAAAWTFTAASWKVTGIARHYTAISGFTAAPWKARQPRAGTCLHRQWFLLLLHGSVATKTLQSSQAHHQ